MTENAKNPTAQNTIEDPREYNAESAKSLAAQKDQSPTFDQLDGDVQNLINQFWICVSQPDMQADKFPDISRILEAFRSPNAEPMTAVEAQQAITTLILSN